jgi:segregation and condensation protein B
VGFKDGRMPATPSAALLDRLEALRFVAEEPLTARRLAAWLGLPAPAELPPLIARLNARYEAEGSAFTAQTTAAGHFLATRPELHAALKDWWQAQGAAPLGDAALQALAVVAYRQPITRADVESYRGVPCAEVLKGLLDEGWIKAVGKEESLGRPTLYGTTRKFLAELGFASLGELPHVAGLVGPHPAPPESDEDAAEN